MDTISILNPDKVSWQEYKALRLQALLDEPQAFGSSYTVEKDTTDEEWQMRLHNYQVGEHNWMFFAQVDTNLVGMLGGFQTDEDQKEHTAMIIGMFVVKEQRGKGIAKLLMERVLHELKMKGIFLAKINVNVDQTIALQMYQKFGFVIKSKVNYRMGDGKYHDEYCLEKSLQ